MLFWHPDELRLYQPTTYVYGIKEKEEHVSRKTPVIGV